MQIIHYLDDILLELFPEAKQADNNFEALRLKLIEYYTYGPFKPVVTIKDNLVIIEIDTPVIAQQDVDYRKVVAFCERGRYQDAKQILDQLIKVNPTNSEYHRIYGQILSDQGKVEEAIDSLIDALKWDPRNGYALLMMGNILARSKNDITTAMKYYNKVLEINLKDNIAVNNIGANLMQQGNLDEAKEYFNKALSIDPDYPNTHYGLAMIADAEGDLPSAFFSSTEALRKSKVKDGLYKQAQNLAIQSASKLIQSGIGQKTFNEYLHKLEFEGDMIIKAITDDSIPTAAKMELAENYARDHHIIRYKSNYPAKEHLMMHELVHIDLMIQARKENINQLFSSTNEHKRNYINSEAEWIKKMSRMGMSEDSIAKVTTDLFEGMNRQVYNTPIDLFIEDFLYREYPDLRPYQFLSLFNLTKEAIFAVTDKKIVDLSPKNTLFNSKIYNIISALHFKELYGIDLLNEFNATPRELKTAEDMFSEFLEYRQDKQPGEEYELVQNWAEDLKLENNFELVDEAEYRSKQKSIESVISDLEKDPLGLDANISKKQEEMDTFHKHAEMLGTNMAVVMYMVDALQYFENLTVDQIRNIAYEIAMIGTQGISPDQKGYKVGLIPNKTFSGYHLLAYNYVSWAVAEPDRLDSLRLPFKNEYEMAKMMYKSPK